MKREGAWQGFGGVEVFSDEFNPNDVGQLRENNAYVLIGNVEHELNDNRPFGPFQRASAEIFGVQRFAYADGLNQGLELEFSSRGMLKSFQSVELAIETVNLFGGYDLYETRGLGPWARPRAIEMEVEISTDERRSWVVEPEVGLLFEQGGGRGYSAGLRGDWRLSDRITLEGNLEGEWERDVLAWSAQECAELLDTSVASSNSALARARRTMAEHDHNAARTTPPKYDEQLLMNYVAAFQAFDVDRLVSLLIDDATFSMPPFELWLRGSDEIERWWRGPGSICRNSRTIMTHANGQPAVAVYHDVGGGRWEPFAIHLVDIVDQQIVAITHFMGPTVFKEFELPHVITEPLERV